MQYSGNQATTTENAYPANIVRKVTTDGVGRTTLVVEDPSGLNYITGYQYDGADDLTKVCQGASFVSNPGCTGTGVQARTFTYDSLQRLMHAYNPESAQIITTYGYDANGNLASKLVYFSPEKTFYKLVSAGDLQALLARCNPEQIADAQRRIASASEGAQLSFHR